ncbi:palindromic element RPE1 domain-containing protein [Candidatus Tisiphia endosymbiont of Myopa tessellatipennis]|uniref:palindromic element RPE1 domain-containing protein n=1 Tax=Candidatus Tisiphia endosymbiont of Myopa tessellatipennis TaxID=3066257 RepID=UPI00313E3921
MLKYTRVSHFKSRPLAEFASAREFVGGPEPRPAAYSNVREDSSLVPTHKLPAEVELCKRSSAFIELMVRIYHNI